MYNTESVPTEQASNLPFKVTNQEPSISKASIKGELGYVRKMLLTHFNLTRNSRNLVRILKLTTSTQSTTNSGVRQHTAGALILDGGDGALLAPVHRVRRLGVRIPEARLALRPPGAVDSRPGVLPPELLVREVGELGQPQPVAQILLGVPLDVGQVVLPHQEPLRALLRRAVHLPVPRRPRRELARQQILAQITQVVHRHPQQRLRLLSMAR
jgi:hypothetical protein